MGDRLLGLSSTSLARALSIAGHPFLLIPLMIAVATRNWVWTAAIAAGMILPMLAITIRNVRRGAWSDHDVSRQDQRLGLYRVAFPLLAVSTVLLYFLGAGRGMLRGMAAAAVMLALGTIGNRFLKISMHMMTAAYATVVIVKIYPMSAWILVPFTAAIAWSRRKLERHTWPEVVVGLAIGTAAALFATAS
jgi:membrane-associated phospholipid phosphatase